MMDHCSAILDQKADHTMVHCSPFSCVAHCSQGCLQVHICPLCGVAKHLVHKKLLDGQFHERQVYIQWTQLMHTSKCAITYK